MDSIELTSYAKINLSIDVLDKREDGYHEVEMILQEVDLSDIVHIEKRNMKIEVSCSVPYLPCDDRNIAYKAARVFFDHTGLNAGAGITITKNIPVSAGLGGGSSNAASVLTGLNMLYGKGMDEDELEKLAGQLGSDVPFFIRGGTALCRGRGEKVTPINTDSSFDIVIVKPDIALSTKDVYGAFDPGCISCRPLTGELIDALEANDSAAVSKNLVNVLENAAVKIYPEIRDIKTKLIELGALNSLMSGSGSAVFGIFKNRYDAVTAADRMADGRYRRFVVKTKVRR